MTRALSPRCAAVSAAVIPAAPLPATTTSTSSILEHVTVLPSAEEGGPVEATVETTVPGDWDLAADVVVVGFGAAGACAALEAAAAGASVLVLDRFGGGGATALFYPAPVLTLGGLVVDP